MGAKRLCVNARRGKRAVSRALPPRSGALQALPSHQPMYLNAMTAKTMAISAKVGTSFIIR